MKAEGVQETRANSGNAYELKASNLKYKRSTGVSDEEVPSKYSDTELNFASVSNPKFTINGVLDRTVADDVANALVLDKFCITKGLKALYYNSTADGYDSLLSAFGATTNGDTTAASLGIGADTKWVVVRCLDYNINQNKEGKTLPYTLICEVTTA